MNLEYIYALDIKKREITAALSCPDETTAEAFCWIVSQKMKEEYNTAGFDFGYATVSDDIDFPTEIWYTSPPQDGQKESCDRSIICRYSDFVFAEMRTKECVRTKKRPLDILFMYFTKLLLEGEPLPTELQPLKTESVRKNRDILAGTKMAAVKFAIENPGMHVYLIEQKYKLKEKSLSRKPYREMIKNGRNMTRNQSARKFASEDEISELRKHNQLGDRKPRNKKR